MGRPEALRKGALLMAFCCQCLLLSAPAAAAADRASGAHDRDVKSQAKVRVRLVEQKHYVGGTMRLYLSPTAVRLEHDVDGLVIISRAPFKNMIMVNPQKKNYITRPTREACQAVASGGMMLQADNPLEESVWVKGEKASIFGLPAQTFMRKTEKKSWGKLWSLAEPAYPNDVAELVAAMCSYIPYHQGLTLRYEEYRSLADERAGDYETLPRKVSVDFQSVSVKNVDVADTIFQAPKGYPCVNGTNNAQPSSNMAGRYRTMMENPDFMFRSDKSKLKKN